MNIKLLGGVCLGKDAAGNVVDGEPGKVYDVPDWLAKSLIHRGKAEAVEAKDDEGDSGGSGEKPIEDMKAGELVKYAEAHSLDIGGLQPQAGKEKVLAAVKLALQKQAEDE